MLGDRETCTADRETVLTCNEVIPRRFTTEFTRGETTAEEVAHELFEVRNRVPGDTSGFARRALPGRTVHEARNITGNGRRCKAHGINRSQVRNKRSREAGGTPKGSGDRDVWLRLLLVYRGRISAA